MTNPSRALKRIILEAVPQHCMRPPYDQLPGCGDWRVVDDELHIAVAAETMDDEAFLIALHEMIEAKLCLKHGVDQAAVDRFDEKFEVERNLRLHSDDAEPGDDPRAPYRKEHRAAMLVEHLTAQFLGLDSYGTIR